MNFASDNAAGVAPPILDAIRRANDGFALGYGDDSLTRRAERALCDLFERDVAAFMVATGTAANSLAIAQLAPPWGAVLCHREAHIMTSECGAPEFFGGGLKLVGLPGDDGRITTDILEVALVVSQRYGFQLRSDDADNARIFTSLASLTEHIAANRVS